MFMTPPHGMAGIAVLTWESIIFRGSNPPTKKKKQTKRREGVGRREIGDSIYRFLGSVPFERTNDDAFKIFHELR